jgi:hypothetical protein
VAAGFVVWSLAPLDGFIIPPIGWYVKRVQEKNMNKNIIKFCAECTKRRK